MSKKIMLLALAAVSATVLALPAAASALVPLHLNPTPAGAKAIDGVGASLLSTESGTTTACTTMTGAATFESGGTTGNMNLTWHGCTESVFGTACTTAGQPSGTIVSTTLPFHLVTLPGNSPGVLVTTNPETGVLAHFLCAGGLVNVTLGGNGLIGTITAPECGKTSTTATIKFEQEKHGFQKHRKIAGPAGENPTPTEYDLKKGAETAALIVHATITMGTETQLVCT